MVKEGIVLGHKISKKGIEVDKAKIDVIAKLPHPTTVKGIRSFLGHAGFYRRFIQDFSKISRPMTHLLEKNTPFIFSDGLHSELSPNIERRLTEAPILIAFQTWDLPFELKCMQARTSSIGAVLGQRHGETLFSAYPLASNTLIEGTKRTTLYTTTEKELLAIVYAFEKLQIENPYGKTSMMPKEYMNVLPLDDVKYGDLTRGDSRTLPRFADFANYNAGRFICKGSVDPQKEQFFKMLNTTFWDDPFLFKIWRDQVIRLCVHDNEALEILSLATMDPPGGGDIKCKPHAKKIFDSRFPFWPTYYKDAHEFVKNCDIVPYVLRKNFTNQRDDNCLKTNSIQVL
ncbi:reverse transcriptase domain-containing protein [Tanacetum coccineum]